MENVKKKNNKMLIILMIIIMLFVCVFTTVAYFKYEYSSDPIIITTTDLKVNMLVDNLRDNTSISPTVWSNNMDENETNKDIVKADLIVTSNSKINAIYNINLNSTIKQNNLYDGGEISDIKYKIFNKGNLVSEGEFSSETDVEIITGSISVENDLDETYKVYIYINETGVKQDSLRDIDFNFQFSLVANQIEE